MNRTALRSHVLKHLDLWLDGSMPDVIDVLSLGGGEPRQSQYTGVKALMVAILEDAIHCYLRPSGQTRTDAEYWIANPSRRQTFSFCVVCETLGLDPDAVRTAIQRLPRTPSATRRVLPRSRPNARRRQYAADAIAVDVEGQHATGHHAPAPIDEHDCPRPLPEDDHRWVPGAEPSR